MGPTGATVLRDVLVADVGDKVLAVDSVPVPLGGEVVDGGKRSLDKRLSSVRVADAAGLGGVDLAESAKGDGAEKGSDSE